MLPLRFSVPAALFPGEIAQPFENTLYIQVLCKRNCGQQGNEECNDGWNGKYHDDHLLGPVPVMNVEVNNRIGDCGIDITKPSGNGGHKMSEEVNQEKGEKV